MPSHTRRERHGESPTSMPADPASSLAAVLESTSVTYHSQMHDWLSQPRDITLRLLDLDSLPDGQGPSASSPPCAPPSARSHSSSMAPACIHQSNASTRPPSLSYYSDATTPTETSVSTALASQFTGMPLLEEVNGTLERPPNRVRAPIYECAFWFLSCPYISCDEEEWETHCLAHFRCEEPPRTVRCPLCDFTLTGDDGWTAWSHRMRHIAMVHVAVGHTLKRSRPDFHLFQHLWQKRLIDEQDLKELKGGNHNLTRPPSNFTVTNGRREREGRRQRQQQHVASRPQHQQQQPGRVSLY